MEQLPKILIARENFANSVPLFHLSYVTVEDTKSIELFINEQLF